MSKFTAVLFVAAIGNVAGDCHAAGDCSTCIGGPGCGWCAVNVTYPTSVGPQCVNLHESFDCTVQFQTDKCQQGWKCGGSGNSSQCVPSVGGIADKDACEKSCKKPPPPPPKPHPPTPPKPKQAYKCNNSTLTCEPVRISSSALLATHHRCARKTFCTPAHPRPSVPPRIITPPHGACWCCWFGRPRSASPT